MLGSLIGVSSSLKGLGERRKEGEKGGKWRACAIGVRLAVGGGAAGHG